MSRFQVLIESCTSQTWSGTFDGYLGFTLSGDLYKCRNPFLLGLKVIDHARHCVIGR